MVIISKHCSTSHSAAASTSLTHVVSGSHQFKIVPYSVVKLLAINEFVSSATFTVDGCEWVIIFYPNGFYSHNNSCINRMLIRLERQSEGQRIENVVIKFVLLDKSGNPLDRTSAGKMQVFEGRNSVSTAEYLNPEPNVCVLPRCLKDDCLTVECTVSILKRSAKMVHSIVVPPSELGQDFGSLFEGEEGSDVTFEVSGQTFNVHRCVLAARSSVFKAEFYGHMKVKMGETIKVIEMEAPVFKAMLHFVYTDSLPDLSEVSENNQIAMVQHLLVAADRYGLERLKILCAEMLYNNIDESNILSVLALAVRHNCSELKNACLELIAASNTLKDVMMDDEFECLIQVCPSIIKELCKKMGS